MDICMNILLHINKYFLRFALLLLFVAGGTLCVNGQDVDDVVIKASVEIDTDDLDFWNQHNPYKDVRIYVFSSKNRADEAMAKLKTNSSKQLNRGDDLYFSAEKTDQNGKFTIEVPSDAYLVVCLHDYGYAPVMRSVANSNGEKFVLKKTADKTQKSDGSIFGKDDKGNLTGEDLDEVEIKGKKDKVGTTPISKSTARGDTLIGTIKFTIPYKLSSNMRVVVQPIWNDRIDIADGENDTVFSYGYAFFDDKKEYSFTQRRRMAFDMSNDSLYRYLNENSSLRTYDDNGNCSNITFSPKEDTIYVNIIDRLWGHDPDCSHPYPFGGIVNVYDYNSKVHTYKYTNDGERSNPLKFLDFSFQAFVPNPEDFKETMADRAMKEEAEIHLNFDVNSTEIKLDDSINIRNLRRVHEDFGRILESKSTPNPITVLKLRIVGVASPEGDVSRNKMLANGRAQSLANVITRYLSGRDERPTLNESDVAPWEALVDVLKRKGYDDKAEEIKAICDKNAGRRDLQYTQIRNLPYYSTLLKDSILPELRTVKYVATLSQNRQMKASEVLDNYKRNKKNIRNRADFWNLFNAMYEDKDCPALELENAAKYALQTTRREDDPEYKNQGYWAYAACILASQYIARDTCDLDLLKPFLDLKLEKDSTGKIGVKQFDQMRRANSQGDVITYAYTNAPLVAANQLIMLLKQTDPSLKKDIPALESLLQSGDAANNMQYKVLLAFSKCLRGGYKGGGGFTEEEAEQVRNFISATSVTNAVVINLAVDDKKHIAKATEVADQLPDNAVSEYLKAVLALKQEKKDKKLAEYHLANSFVRDIKMMPIASNDRDLILDDDEPTNRAISGAIKLWQDTMRTIVAVKKKVIRTVPVDTVASDSLPADSLAAASAVADAVVEETEEFVGFNEKHPFTWYMRAMDMLRDKNDANDDEAKAALFKCFDLDKRYISVMNVSLIKDNSIRQNKELKTKLKAFRNEYNQGK